MKFIHRIFISLLLLALVGQPLAYAKPASCADSAGSIANMMADSHDHSMHTNHENMVNTLEQETPRHLDSNCCDTECDSHCGFHYNSQLTDNPVTANVSLSTVDYFPVTKSLIFQIPDPLLRPPISR